MITIYLEKMGVAYYLATRRIYDDQDADLIYTTHKNKASLFKDTLYNKYLFERIIKNLSNYSGVKNAQIIKIN